MKKLLITILVGVLGGASASLYFKAPKKVNDFIQLRAENAAVRKVEGSSHVIYMESPVAGQSGCSATSIGPHVLLTASHCEEPTGTLTIDGKSGVKILKIYRDENDHSILFLDGVKFDYVSKVTPRKLRDKEFVFIWGNPGGSGVQFVKDLRVGKFLTQNVFKGRLVDVFELDSQHGDSGSAIFDINGNIVDVLSIGGNLVVPHYGDVENATGALELAFDQAKYEEAARF
jgi:hypothetical protein